MAEVLRKRLAILVKVFGPVISEPNRSTMELSLLAASPKRHRRILIEPWSDLYVTTRKVCSTLATPTMDGQLVSGPQRLYTLKYLERDFL